MSARPVRWGPLVVVLPVIVMIAGCTSAGAPGPTPPDSAPTASSTTRTPGPDPSGPDPSTTESPDPQPTVRPSSARPVQQISGTVMAGVEAGCLLLDAGGGQDWLLLGETTGLRAGQQATLEGRPDPRVVSTCQQGTPFRVTRVL